MNNLVDIHPPQINLFECQQALAECCKDFKYVSGYKAELSIWDHSLTPHLTLYVRIGIGETGVCIHTRSQTLEGAIAEVKTWYSKVSNLKQVA